MEHKTIFTYDKDIFPITVHRKKYLQEQVIRLKKIKQPEQKTEGWYLMRENKITASDIATAIDESKYQRDYILMKKKATRDRTFISSRAMSWGIKYEDVAIKIYELRNSTKVIEYGCIPHPVHDWIGASPDGITDDGVMLEIKCPSSRKITGETPHHYWCQVQTQLEVCELDRCDFLECKFEEYSCQEDYNKDNFNGDFHENSLGLEKGVTVEHYNEKTKKNVFDFSEIGIIGMDVIRFIKKCKKKYKENNNISYSGISYWNLRQVSCIPIYRNQAWFNEKLYVLKRFWDNVLKYRNKSIEDIDKYILERKQKKKIAKDESITNYFNILNNDSSGNDTKKNDIFVGITDNNYKKHQKNNNNPEFGSSVFDDLINIPENTTTNSEKKFFKSNKSKTSPKVSSKVSPKISSKVKSKTSPKVKSKTSSKVSSKVLSKIKSKKIVKDKPIKVSSKTSPKVKSKKLTKIKSKSLPKIKSKKSTKIKSKKSTKIKSKIKQHNEEENPNFGFDIFSDITT